MRIQKKSWGKTDTFLCMREESRKNGCTQRPDPDVVFTCVLSLSGSVNDYFFICKFLKNFVFLYKLLPIIANYHAALIIQHLRGL